MGCGFSLKCCVCDGSKSIDGDGVRYLCDDLPVEVQERVHFEKTSGDNLIKWLLETVRRLREQPVLVL